MAIAVLISSPAEAERFTTFGLEIASRMDATVVFLCIKQDVSEGKKKPESEPSEDSDIPPENGYTFPGSRDYTQSTRELVSDHLATMAFGFVKNEVVEVPGNIDEFRKWLNTTHQSPRVGYFDIETLFVPMLRGAGLENARQQKDRLFEASQIETIYVSIDESLTGRLPLNNIGVSGQRPDDVLMASRFARRFSNVRVSRMNDEQRDPDQQCVIVAIQGKALQTRIDNHQQWKALRKDKTIPLAMVLNPVDSMGERINSAIDDKMRHWFQAYQLSREDRIQLSAKLEAGAASSPEFILFMSVATFLACIGLIQDSAAVIIGAMLVAPLMTPLLGAGLAMIYGNKPLFLKAVKSILLGVGLAFAIGTIVGLFSIAVPEYLLAGSGLSLTNEMISRSQPNLLDPFIGLAAGMAGGFAIGRDGQIGTVAGVAIAAALVPPIATAGLEAALAINCTFLSGDITVLFQILTGDPAELLDAQGLLNDSPKPTTYVHLVSAPLILFTLNACATIIGAFVGLRMVGMHRTSTTRHSKRWVMTFMIILLGAILLLMVLPVIMFGW